MNGEKKLYAFTQCKREDLFVHSKAATARVQREFARQHVVTFMPSNPKTSAAAWQTNENANEWMNKNLPPLFISVDFIFSVHSGLFFSRNFHFIQLFFGCRRVFVSVWILDGYVLSYYSHLYVHIAVTSSLTLNSIHMTSAYKFPFIYE